MLIVAFDSLSPCISHPQRPTVSLAFDAGSSPILGGADLLATLIPGCLTCNATTVRSKPQSIVWDYEDEGISSEDLMYSRFIGASTPLLTVYVKCTV
jgi:hypothetical protein